MGDNVLKQLYADKHYLSKNASSNFVNKFLIRLPPQMRDMINEVARLNHRSMNSQIVACLTRSLYHTEINNPFVFNDFKNISDSEKLVLESFRRMPLKRREALFLLLEKI